MLVHCTSCSADVSKIRAASPIVAFVGECGTTDYGHAQNFDQARFAAACEAGFVRVDSPETVDEAVRKGKKCN